MIRKIWESVESVISQMSNVSQFENSVKSKILLRVGSYHAGF